MKVKPMTRPVVNPRAGFSPLFQSIVSERDLVEVFFWAESGFLPKQLFVPGAFSSVLLIWFC